MKFENLRVGELRISNLVELLATVSFRIMGFQFVILTVYYLFLFESDKKYLVNSNTSALYQNHTIQVYVMEIAFHTVTAVALIVLSGPLAKLICRGLFQISDNYANN
jgi:hypothetical protein